MSASISCRGRDIFLRDGGREKLHFVDLDSFSGYLAAPVLEIGVGHGSYAGVLPTTANISASTSIRPRSTKLANVFPRLDFRCRYHEPRADRACQREKGQNHHMP